MIVSNIFCGRVLENPCRVCVGRRTQETVSRAKVAAGDLPVYLYSADKKDVEGLARKCREAGQWQTTLPVRNDNIVMIVSGLPGPGAEQLPTGEWPGRLAGLLERIPPGRHFGSTGLPPSWAAKRQAKSRQTRKTRKTVSSGKTRKTRETRTARARLYASREQLREHMAEIGYMSETYPEFDKYDGAGTDVLALLLARGVGVKLAR